MKWWFPLPPPAVRAVDTGRRLRLLAVVTLVMAMASPVAAESGSSTAESAPGVREKSARSEAETAVSQWDRFRSNLEERGISFDLGYTGEVFRGFDLADGKGTEYRGMVNLYFALNTEKMGLWPGGELFVDAQNGHGRGLSLSPGGVDLPISNIDAEDYTEIYEYGIIQTFLDEMVQFRLGKQDLNNIFSVNDFGGNFIFPSFTLIPTVPMPTFPAPALGGAAFIEPVQWLSLGMGFYDGGPEINSLGFDTAFDGKGGYFSIFEPAWTPGFGENGRYQGNYRLGFWYHSGNFAATQPDHRQFSDNYGLYLLFDQLVYRPNNGGNDDRGIGVFLQFGWAPKDRNPVSRYLGGGFSWKGFLSWRPHDSIAVGLGHSRLVGSQPPGKKTDLTHLEVFYMAQLTPWLSLQPDIQYFDNPAVGKSNGWALGLRWLFDF